MLSNVPDDNKTIMIGVQATLGEADKEYQSIVGLVREVESIVKQHQIPGGLENPYTTLTAHVSLVLILIITVRSSSNWFSFTSPLSFISSIY